MPKILAIHGIGQQFKGDQVIHDEWWGSLVSGLHLAGHSDLVQGDLYCPFYGDLFRDEEHLGGDSFTPSQLEGRDGESLLLALWKEAARVDPSIMSPDSDETIGSSLARSPKFVQVALQALSKSEFFVGLARKAMIGDLLQVINYLGNVEVRANIQKRVAPHLTDDVKVVIGHSLGSVVAYEALCAQKHSVHSFITLGSPLGIRNLVFDKLIPVPENGLGHWPKVKMWTNIADKGDIVALEKSLGNCFGDGVTDLLVNNGSDAHGGNRYLTTIQAGQAIRDGL